MVTAGVDDVVVNGTAMVAGAATGDGSAVEEGTVRVAAGGGSVVEERADVAAELTGEVAIGVPTGTAVEGSPTCEHAAAATSTTETTSQPGSLGRLIRS